MERGVDFLVVMTASALLVLFDVDHQVLHGELDDMYVCYVCAM